VAELVAKFIVLCFHAIIVRLPIAIAIAIFILLPSELQMLVEVLGLLVEHSLSTQHAKQDDG